jgi:hypothetical protein
MATEKFTQEELDGLTNEEREGLLEGEDGADEGDEDGAENADPKAADEDKTTDGADAGAGAADSAKDDADAGEADAGKKTAATTDAAAETEDKAKAGDTGADADGKAETEEEPEPQPDIAARYQPKEGSKERLDAIRDEMAALAEKVDDGEITAREYREQSDKLTEERDEIKQSMFRAQLAADRARDDWADKTVPAFLDKHDYVPGTIKYEMLDREVRRLQTETGRQFDPGHLAAAHAAVLKRLEAELGVKPSARKEPPIDEKNRQRREIPPTLAGLPATDVGEADDGEFAHLAKLSGEDLENAMMKLSEDQRDRYLESQAR